MINRFHLRKLAAVVGVWFLAALSVNAAPRAHHVFIISFDQGNPDLIQQTEMPTFHRMAAAGAHTWEAYTIVPSTTLPSHTSMLTGVGTQKHRVTWNDYDTKKTLVKVPTIFSLAKEYGLKTAMFVSKEKFKHLELPGSLDKFVLPDPHDDAKSVAKAFAAEVGSLKPNLCFIHFRDPDTEGHAHGNTSPSLGKLADYRCAIVNAERILVVEGRMRDPDEHLARRQEPSRSMT